MTNPALQVVQSAIDSEAAQRVFQSRFWKYATAFAERTIYPFYKTKSDFSFGKLWCSILLGIGCYHWGWLGIDVPDTLESMIWVQLAYVFSTKPVQIIRDRVNKKSELLMPGPAGSDTPKATPAVTPAGPAIDMLPAGEPS